MTEMIRKTYGIIARTEAGKPAGGPPKYYPALLPLRKATEEDVMLRMEREYGIKRAEYKRFIMALEDMIVKLLETHNHIELGALGYVRLEIQTSGADRPELVTQQNVKKATLHLRFSQVIKQGLKQLRFEKASSR
tara:strand:- start:30781 stop:31185 length:405 start_codon:yes stop_codon:yes gene_type:complete